MANRFWVGGAGNWASTTKWSTTSGGTSGASVPTSVDDVIFDANSGGKFIATVDTAQSVNSITITPSAAVGVQQIALSARLTTGNLTTTGTAGNNRIWFRGTTYGIAQDFVVNGTVSISDCDFRDIYVIGTAAPISGTRIGDLRGCRGITFDAPKTVYWNLAGAQNWSANGWSDTSTGTPNTNFFPLTQDTATFTNAGSVTGTITMDAAVPYTGTVDMSGRTSAMTLGGSTGYAVYGNWVLGSGVTQSYSGALTFSGRNTQTITSAGKTFSGGITIDSYGGTVELADALNIGTRNLTVTNGTFDTKGYNVTAGPLLSTNSNVREIKLGASTVTLSDTNAITFTTSTNLTFDAGTSSIVASAFGAIINGGGQAFYDFSLSNNGGGSTISGANTFNSLSITAPSSAGLRQVTFAGDQTITGTLTAAGATAVRRVMLRSSVLGTTRTLTVGTLSATDCDFRDITIAGTAAGSSPTRAGDCGGNSGVTFPAPKTVYRVGSNTTWAGSNSWALTSGGAGNNNNYPLPQDTAVIDNVATAASIQITELNISALDMSARTNAITVSGSANAEIYGSLTVGSGVSFSYSATLSFSGRGTSTITSAGKVFTGNITINCFTGTVQLADALTLASNRNLTLTSGTFDAVTYNVTTGFFESIVNNIRTLKMGSGTWTISGATNVWNIANASTLTFYKGTADILLSSTSTTTRTFAGSNLSYNKLTIGGATGTSTLTISGNNTFTELASTKTVAHTIDLGTTAQTFGAWTVSGTVGNVVTVTGTGTSHVIAGARVSGVDYLAMGTIGFAATSPGEFYAGVNSTGSNPRIIKTAAPTPVTRYWVGGTGTWDETTTTKWSDTSGGSGGFSVPTSADAVVFDALSNATAYTVTCTATQLRCGSLTMAGPLVGNVTWAGSAPIAMHDNVSLAATGLTRTYNGNITLSGSATGRTLTTNGVTLASATTVNGVGCGWTLGSALDIGSSTLNVTNGSFNTGSYNLTAGTISTNSTNTIAITLGSSVVSLSSSAPIGFGNTETQRANFTFTADTSQFNFISLTAVTLNGNNSTFYNVSATTTDFTTLTIRGANTFNNLTTAGRTSAGVSVVSLEANQTINGTLTLSAGTNATMRTFVQSDIIGTTRTLTCAAVASLQDIDFRDITIAGAAAPVSGTRLGDCKGNSGITFVAGANKYWNTAGGGNWSANWALSSGGATNANNFPLAQDTCFFEATGLNSGATVTINAAYNIGTIDMSARTSNTMTLATGTTTPTIYGNWINGTGTTLTGTGQMTFAGRGSQTITSAGKTFTQAFRIFTPGGSVTLQDAFSCGSSVLLVHGDFDSNSYAMAVPAFSSSNSNTRTVNLGSSLWAIAGSTGSVWSATSTNLTVTGTGTISLTSASAKTFAGGDISYSGITLNQGGAGTLTISGNNTFANITNTYSATGATTIAMGTTTQRVGSFTASGEAGRVLTVTGTSASSPATLVFTGSGQATAPTTDYLTITGVRAYNLTDTWYAGANSTNNGSLGWYFEAGLAPTSDIYYGAINITAIYYGSTPVTAIYYGAVQVY